jgi:ribosomal protein S2
MSWKPEVHSDSTGRWVGNALRFATKEEAEGNVHAFAKRWVSRVIECDEPVNYRWVGGRLVNVGVTTPLARVNAR